MSGLIGIPCRDTSRGAAFWQSLYNLDKPADTQIEIVSQSSIARARNMIAQCAIDRQLDWVLMVDDDMLLPKDTLTRLLATSQQVEIVSALYLYRYFPFAPAAIEQWVEGKGGRPYKLMDVENTLLMVAAVGTGCCLFHTSVFDKLPRPWFVCGTPVPDLISEDYTFCRMAVANGVDIWLDGRVKVGHMAPLGVWPERGSVAFHAPGEVPR